ncbi:hypothetical protein [Neptunomonas marina]|uniref:DUF202 domain-containing protein n=1 Tax=Neptunomonas marina TaxID=1815562 RepID=A0A437Q4A3_9GAMM|nr:hypothetical protein [Neptunomonas marina]RVU29334.1 hypothetical protein EOE65_17070 [Neptunomonas marina]
MNTEDRIKEIDKKIRMQSLMDAPGSAMVGLGLYAKFAADGDAFHPLLNDATVVNAMLSVGAAIMIWGGYRIFALYRERRRIVNEVGF